VIHEKETRSGWPKGTKRQPAVSIVSESCEVKKGMRMVCLDEKDHSTRILRLRTVLRTPAHSSGRFTFQVWRSSHFAAPSSSIASCSPCCAAPADTRQAVSIWEFRRASHVRSSDATETGFPTCRPFFPTRQLQAWILPVSTGLLERPNTFPCFALPLQSGLTDAKSAE
jgi:hypothetical protein